MSAQSNRALVFLWVKQVLDQVERACPHPEGQRGRVARDPKHQKIVALEARVAQQEPTLAQKNEVIAVSSRLRSALDRACRLGTPSRDAAKAVA